MCKGKTMTARKPRPTLASLAKKIRALESTDTNILPRLAAAETRVHVLDAQFQCVREAHNGRLAALESPAATKGEPEPAHDGGWLVYDPEQSEGLPWLASDGVWHKRRDDAPPFELYSEAQQVLSTHSPGLVSRSKVLPSAPPVASPGEGPRDPYAPKNDLPRDDEDLERVYRGLDRGHRLGLVAVHDDGIRFGRAHAVADAARIAAGKEKP